MHQSTFIAAAALLFSAVGCVDENDLCAASGEFPAAVVLEADSFLVEGSTGLLFTTDDKRYPYVDGSPFKSCRAVGGLVVRERIGDIDGDRDFPAIEELGSIFVDFPDDAGAEHAVKVVSGFDNVTSFGGIAGNLGLGDFGSVAEVSGFNGLQTVDGSLQIRGRLTGFTAATDIGGTLAAVDYAGLTRLESVGADLGMGGDMSQVNLPALADVGGDLVVQQSLLHEIVLPSLVHVGGEILVDGNTLLERWEGMSDGGKIDGNFTASFNQPMTNAEFQDWIDGGSIAVGGRIKICRNGNQLDPGEDTCNEM